ncbi:hypothetical protein CCP3SC5AM1_1870003 [Gammaproteobacteria bacterium]
MSVLEQIQHHIFHLPQEARMEVLNFILHLEQQQLPSIHKLSPELIEKNGILVIRVKPLSNLTDAMRSLREERIDNLIQGTGL